MTLALGRLAAKDLLCTSAMPLADIERIYSVAAELKRGRSTYTKVLEHKRLAMIFEKDSLRTRFTFDIGIQDMGGSAVFMDHRDARIGSRESVKDIAKNLERWVHGIVARTFKHRAIEELAQHARIPVINGLSDLVHPCQGLTDLFTLTEKWGTVRGKTIAYVGDGNNTCSSLVLTALKLGANVRVCSPESYEPKPLIHKLATRIASETGVEYTVTRDPDHGADGADAIYTDVWASMGQEDEIEERNGIFAAYQVDEAMMKRANRGAFFMHCLPAHRGWEVTQEVLDGPQSIVFDIAENRLHVQKAIMALLMQ